MPTKKNSKNKSTKKAGKSAPAKKTVQAKCPVPMTAQKAPPLPTTLSQHVELTHSDFRGGIKTLVRHPVEVVQLITSHPGSHRAGHYHKAGWHFCHVLSGIIHYFERPVGSQEQPKMTVIGEGETFFTGPMMEHTMYFPVETTFLNIANSERTAEDYEADLVRLPAHLDKIVAPTTSTSDPVTNSPAASA